MSLLYLFLMYTPITARFSVRSVVHPEISHAMPTLVLPSVQEGELRGSYRPCGYPGVGPTQRGFSSAFELSFIATVVVRDGGPLQLSFPIETSSKHLPPLLWVHFH